MQILPTPHMGGCACGMCAHMHLKPRDEGQVGMPLGRRRRRRLYAGVPLGEHGLVLEREDVLPADTHARTLTHPTQTLTLSC